MASEVETLSVEAAYDRWAQVYDDADNPMVFGASRALAAGAVAFAGLDVFELGCGTGRNLAFLKEAGARSVAGCDLSEGMLAKARRRLPHVDVFRHDMAEPLSRPPASVDAALFCLALEHAPDLAPPLASAARLVRPGGLIAIFEIHPFVSQTGVAAHFMDGGREIRMPAFPHRMSDYIAAFTRTGLAIGACREWRPTDLGPDLPARVLKRGADYPLIVEWRLAKA